MSIWLANFQRCTVEYQTELQIWGLCNCDVCVMSAFHSSRCSRLCSLGCSPQLLLCCWGTKSFTTLSSKGQCCYFKTSMCRVLIFTCVVILHSVLSRCLIHSVPSKSMPRTISPHMLTTRFWAADVCNLQIVPETDATIKLWSFEFCHWFSELTFFPKAHNAWTHHMLSCSLASVGWG